MKILIVGAGFSGSVIARELAEKGCKVEIIDKRDHIGGNAYDYLNEQNIRIHKYGPHFFHTNNVQVYDFLSKFTEWVPYQHKAKAMLDNGELVTIPVNQETKLRVGENNIVETFIRPYTEKMWGMKLEQIDPQIINRVPIRNDEIDLYFPNDQFQCMPKDGYTQLFSNLLNHPNIILSLNTPFSKTLESKFDHIFNSMPIDEYHNYCFGHLNYRSIKFHTLTLPIPRLFPVVQVNFVNTGKYTRIIEWKNIPGQSFNNLFTTVTYEEPCDYKENNEQRFYPVKDLKGENKKIYDQYKSIKLDKVTFIGRLGQYVYLDMHQCVSSALIIAKNFINEKNL